MRGEEGVAGFQPMSTAVHRSPNILWRSNSVFNLWLTLNIEDIAHAIGTFVGLFSDAEKNKFSIKCFNIQW